MFYAGGLGYYAQLLSLSYISGLKAKGYYQLAAGYGTVGYEPVVDTFFGIPRGIKTGGVAFDIPMIHVIANQENDAEKAKQFTLQVGTLSSALEHITPEQMFAPTDPTQPKPDAISAVKALQKASAAGQRIYQINQANMNQVLPLLHHDRETLNEIKRALNVGKDVTTHTDAVSIPGDWSGFGYIITDPVVGDGVYKISGGANGGLLGLIGTKLQYLLQLLLETLIPSAHASNLDTVGNVLNLFAYVFGLTDFEGCSASSILRYTIVSIVFGLFIGLAMTLLLPGLGGMIAGLVMGYLATAVASQEIVNNTCSLLRLRLKKFRYNV